MSTKKSNLINMFCLEGMLLDRIEAMESEVHLYVRSPRVCALCPYCEATTKRIHKTCYRKIKHSILDHKIINLKLKVRNFYCKECGHYFRESIPGIDKRRTSLHFRKNIIPKLKDRSFRAVAKEHNLSVSSLMRSTVSLLNEQDIIWPKGKFMMGIDEHSFSSNKDYVLTITDLTNHNVLTVLKNDKKETLRMFLQKIPEDIKQNIICVCVDMRRMFFNLAKEELNDIEVVVDKFHVIQHLNWHLNELRTLFTHKKYYLPKKLLERNKEDLNKEQVKALKIIFKKYPAIKEFWTIKELIRDMYRMKNKEKAIQAFEVILSGLELDSRTRWKALYTSLNKWKKEILNYFTFRITNAYTEGVHTRMKLLKRISYGFRNKSNYIAKMTLAFLPFTVLVQMIETSPSLT